MNTLHATPGSPSTVVMGIGNPLLQDDRAGIAVVEALEQLHLPGVACEILYTVGFEVIDKLKGYERAIILDACVLGHAPGTVHEVTVDDIFTNASLTGSHAITLGTTVKTGLMVFPEEMPKEIRIILMEAACPTEFSTTCSPEVQAAIERVIAQLRAELSGPPIGPMADMLS